MNGNRVRSGLILGLNVVGLVCLVCLIIPYLTHNTQVPYPDAMLPSERWDRAGIALTVGMVPLFIANLSGFLFIRLRSKGLKFLFFLPSAVCIAVTVHYWVSSLAQ